MDLTTEVNKFVAARHTRNERSIEQQSAQLVDQFLKEFVGQPLLVEHIDPPYGFTKSVFGLGMVRDGQFDIVRSKSGFIEKIVFPTGHYHAYFDYSGRGTYSHYNSNINLEILVTYGGVFVGGHRYSKEWTGGFDNKELIVTVGQTEVDNLFIGKCYGLVMIYLQELYKLGGKPSLALKQEFFKKNGGVSGFNQPKASWYWEEFFKLGLHEGDWTYMDETYGEVNVPALIRERCGREEAL